MALPYNVRYIVTMENTQHTADKDAGRRAKINGQPGGTIAWPEHVKAWESYHRNHPGQSAERINERGGFGLIELVQQLGHMPLTWEPNEQTRFIDRHVLPPGVGE